MIAGYGVGRISATIKALADPEILAACVNPLSFGNPTAILESLNQELLMMISSLIFANLVATLVAIFSFVFADLVPVIK